MQIIDGKACLISDLFCDGLGACIGHCPEDAITIEEREAEEYNEKRVMENIVKQGKNVIKAHLMHLKEHNDHKHLKEAMEVLEEKNIEIPLQEIMHAAHKHTAAPECPGQRLWNLEKKRKLLRKKGLLLNRYPGSGNGRFRLSLFRHSPPI